MKKQDPITRMMDKTAAGFAARSAFVASILVIIVWAMTGPLAGFSDTWQLIINTGTTVLTFIAVFALQYAQKRDTAAIMTKLDAIIAGTADASNELLGIESESTPEILAKQREIQESAKDESPEAHGPATDPEGSRA